MEDEGEGIGFLARLEVLALINIKQIDVLEQFLLGSKGSTCEVCELNGFIHKERKVTLNFRIFGQIIDNCFILFVLFEQLVPVEICVINFLIDVKSLELFAVDDTDEAECLAVSSFEDETILEEFVLQTLYGRFGEINTETHKDIVHICVELIERGFLFLANPSLCGFVTGEPKSQMRFLGICLEWIVLN